MYRTIAGILFPITLVALIGTGIWGYQEYQDKSSILIKAENQYQRAFHELNDHMDSLQKEVGKTLAINSRKQMSTSMSNVWRLSYAAHQNLTMLPMTIVPFDQAEKFLSHMGSFAFDVGVRDLEKEPLTEKEYQTLNSLYQNATNIRDKLQSTQSEVLGKNLRWMDVELATATEDKVMDNTIIDGFREVDKMVEQFQEVDWGPTVNNMEVRRREKGNIKVGPKITAEQARQKFAQALEVNPKKIKVVANPKGDYPTYSITFQGKHGEVNADMTQMGGYISWLLYDRPVKKTMLSMEQAQAQATEMLANLNIPNMVPISYDKGQNTISFNMVRNHNGILVYPEAASIKVALDNGEILGIQADEFIFNQVKNLPTKPKLSKEEAQKQVSSRLQIQKSNLAYVYNKNNKGVLCYEFLGLLNDDQYRVFINADTGDEEMVEQIKKENTNQI
ncbi:germination protein YpeB [Risungbinella massiliensis]|uniref:germination protein YpeB n=1 Tax=Risungbinella massiliensis TaxID=1329796 RepID=UPI0005CBFFBA|nr:germination protein YpeB [Risungbinella massiliensis]